jgi:mRNA interferase HicA
LYDLLMTGNELIRKLRRLGRERGVEIRYEPRLGKGTHGRLFFGDRLTTLKDPRAEIGKRLLHKVLRDLGLAADDGDQEDDRCATPIPWNSSPMRMAGSWSRSLMS